MAMLSSAMTEYGEVSVVMDETLTTLGLFAGTLGFTLEVGL